MKYIYVVLLALISGSCMRTSLQSISYETLSFSEVPKIVRDTILKELESRINPDNTFSGNFTNYIVGLDKDITVECILDKNNGASGPNDPVFIIDGNKYQVDLLFKQGVAPFVLFKGSLYCIKEYFGSTHTEFINAKFCKRKIIDQ